MEENEKEFSGCEHGCGGCQGCDTEDVNENVETGILTFVDEEGNDVQFEILDVVELDEKEYLVVLPIDEESQEKEEAGVLVLEIKQDDGEEVYDTVMDEEEAEKVFNKFQEQYGEEDEEDESDIEE